MPSLPKPIKLIITTAAAASSVLVLGAAPAAAKTPCWKALLRDWYDGRIDNTYQVHCYRDAIKNLPEDVSVYGSARDDIRRALLAAMAGMKGGPPGPNALIEPVKHGKKAKKHDRGVFGWLADRLGPGGADSIPLPLLVFAGLGLLLIAAAGASFFARRIQARRAQPAPASPGPPQPRK
jgi:hypothetical protein